MRVLLNEERVIKGKTYQAGETAIVRKDEGFRLVELGIADAVIEVPENRVIAPAENRRYSNHTKF